MTKKRQKIRMGCPMKYEDPEKFYKKVVEYFKMCQHKRLVPNRAGLYVHLGITKKTFYNYSNNPDYSDICELAIYVMENFHVQGLYSKFSSGAQFALKNQFDWNAEQKVQNTNLEVEVSYEEYLKGLESDEEY